MKIGAIVQARMSSTRRPGKVLHQVRGQPLLAWLLERLGRARDLDGIVVATSVESDDDAIEQFCRDRGIPWHRGPLDDVARRFLDVVDRFGFDAFVRVTGDAPLLDQRLVSHAVTLFRSEQPEAVSNVRHRSFPRGQSVEVFGSSIFREALPLMTDPADREHVTRYFYRRPYRVLEFHAPGDFSARQLSVDTDEDVARFEAVVERMTRPHWEYGWREILSLADEALAAGMVAR